MARENERRSQAEVVRQMLKNVEEKLSKEDAKATLADYIRLVQLKKELEEDEPREIRVTWIERESESSIED